MQRAHKLLILVLIVAAVLGGSLIAFIQYSPTDGETGGTLSFEIRALPEFGFAPVEVDFRVYTEGSEGNYAYAWNFGDGAYSAQVTPSHIYTRIGTYRVELSMQDSDGRTVTTQLNYSVYDLNDSPYEITWTMYRVVNGEYSGYTEGALPSAPKTKIEVCTWDGTTMAKFVDDEVPSVVWTGETTDPDPGAPPVCTESILSKGVDYDYSHLLSFRFHVTYTPGSELELGWSIRLYRMDVRSP